ncbi:PIG-L family deacetylase, partial [bacterium]
MQLNDNALDLAQAPFRDDLKSWGRTLCVAPHPDDESLGCGGTLALLNEASNEVGVAWVSDGGLSHPNSVKYPRPQLVQLREREALQALAQLGIGADSAYFQRLPDGALPFPGDSGFQDAAASAQAVIEEFRPQTLLLPWRRDPHRDHRASWAIWTYASLGLNLNRYEYLVWAFERAAPHEWP